MPRFIVRPRLTGQAKESGREGADSTLVYTETAAKAREIGADRLGTTDVEVLEYVVGKEID